MFLRRDTKRFQWFWIKNMTRDGGQKLELRNRLINSFYDHHLMKLRESKT